MADASTIFNASLDAIRDTLSDHDRNSFRTFANHEEMVANVKSLSAGFAHKSRLFSCCKRIAAFAQAFAPYFDIINIFVQVKPEWIAWLWGSIRVIFQLGCNLVSFLENVSQMFETISFTLPQYQTWFDVCRRTVQEKDIDRLAQALAFIYADIIEFCLHTYRIFSRASRGSGFIIRATGVGGLLWKPFQTRFSTLLERLQTHQEWFETEAMIQQHELVAGNHESFIKYLGYAEKLQAAEKRRESLEQKRVYARHLEDLRTRISSPRYRDTYEHAKRNRYPGSGKRFLMESHYVTWRGDGFNRNNSTNASFLQKNWIDRMLFLEAKPGYGKTYLSSIVIDDLVDAADNLTLSDEEAPMVAFFHFSSSNQWATQSPDDALKSIVSQLVHAHRDDRLTIDALTMLLNESGSGQMQASTDDIAALLAILLRQHPTYMVIDGVDECSQPENLLLFLKDICRVHDCRVLLLGRPTVTLEPLSELKSSGDFSRSIFTLHGSLNYDDIKEFLQAHFHILVDRGYLGSSIENIDEKCSQDVAHHANGMFLWARLLVNYMECPALTPQERLAILADPTHLEGVDSLYDQILDVLSRYSKKEKAVAEDIFRWISGSIYPLSTAKLHLALAIIPEQQTTKEQHLVNFPECVPRITCALVEINETGNLEYIHLSLKEYLETRRDPDRPFSLQDTGKTNLFLATRCLSYLAYDIPSKPLEPLERPMTARSHGFGEEASANTLQATPADEESFGKVSIIERLDQRYPLLRYTVLCWYTHLTKSRPLSRSGNSITAPAKPPLFDEQSSAARFPEPLEAEIWAPLLARFLVNRLRVTMWVEACSIYRFIPQIYPLIQVLRPLREHDEAETANGREMWWILSGLEQLAGALDDLRRTHIASLMQNPSLIWQDEITAAKDRGFWPVWEDSTTLTTNKRKRNDEDAPAGFSSGHAESQDTQLSKRSFSYVK